MKTVSVLILLCVIAGTSFIVFKSKKVDNRNVLNHRADTISNNYLVVGNEIFILKINNDISKFSNKEDVFQNIKNDKIQILKSRFDIILTEYLGDKEFIIGFTNVLKTENITNYKLISPNQLKILNEQFNFSKEEKITNDIDSVKIEISENNFKISSKDKHLTSEDINKIEEFIKNNSENMRKSQIYILGKKEATFQETKPIFDLLKKYDLLNFKIIAK